MSLNRKIGTWILILMLSIENIYFLNWKILGFDITDIGVLISFIFFLISSKKINNYKIKCSRYVIVMIFYAIFTITFSIFKGHTLRYIMPNARDFIFMVLTFEIFSSSDTDTRYVIRVMPIFGLINSIIFINTTGFFDNTYTREIYTPLWISVLSVSCILFFKEYKHKYLVYAIAFINIIAIVLSQTRSYIIPLILIVLFNFLVTIKQIRIKNVMILTIVICVCIYYLQKIGFYEIILKRMENSFDSDSTLWLRLENSLNSLHNMSMLDWIIGRGFGERIPVIQYDRTLRLTSDLEMFEFNQIYKWGLPIFIYNYYVFIKGAIKNKISTKEKSIIFGFIAILIGGLVSGLSGIYGGMIIGMLFGMLANNTNGENKRELI